MQIYIIAFLPRACQLLLYLPHNNQFLISLVRVGTINETMIHATQYDESEDEKHGLPKSVTIYYEYFVSDNIFVVRCIILL